MLKKSMIAAGAIAVSLVAFQPTTASAGTDVNFYFGFGGGNHGSHGGHGGHGGGWGGGWGGNHGGGWGNHRLTCREARRNLRHSYGFRRIRAIECNGRRYTFRARRGGHVWRVKVNAFTGEVIRMRPL